MTTAIRKQKQTFEAYFESVKDFITFCKRGASVFAFVPSSNKKADSYMVKLDKHNRAVWCDCKDFTYRSAECKHMHAVDELVESVLRERALVKLLAEINAEEAAQRRYYADNFDPDYCDDSAYQVLNY